MGKKRKMGLPKEDATKRQPKKYKNDVIETALLDPSDRKFIYDEINDFEDNRDLVSLETAKKLMNRKKPSREQVLAIDGSSSDDDDDDDEDDEEFKDSEEEEEDPDQLFMEDDIVDTPEMAVPDDRAWGNKKHRYFGTDTTDEKIKWNLYNQDEEMTQLEEETARKLQERMAAELKDLASDDLILQADDKSEKKSSTEDLVEADVSSLSRARKLQLLKRESPEFLPLVEDLKNKCEELKCILKPLMEKVGKGQIPDGPVKQYVITKYRLVLNYVTTISMYMLVKCSTKSVTNHPVIGRLAQYRQLLKELEPCDNKLAAHLGELLSEEPEEDDDDDDDEEGEYDEGDHIKKTKTKNRKPKKLQILKKSRSALLEEKKRLMALLKEPVQEKLTKAKGGTEDLLDNAVDASSDEDQDEQETPDAQKHVLDADEKRAIGYTIAKNKGLMPYRNKDQRNPRVRYRNKYTKKLKRRKGQVQNVRREINRYEGEMTGIKSHTIRSIKIKS
ncbi:LOW QUALITY PROTEIN: something about silencing protein 10-like [Palaemon carinicauda]|uniref:LOW QUALITY PROTEIN: something about silencing protein 10-like n=1 Tax=Palaemon carinicauda TaxID=392227 RepID=UPI0035B65293